MNQTYKSLKAARPSAASYGIPLILLQKMTSTTATPPASRMSAATRSSATSSTTPTSPPSNYGRNSLSGGAIAGIVVGVIGGLAVICSIAFFLYRRKRRSTATQVEPTSPTNDQQQNIADQPDVAELYSPSAPHTEKFARTANILEMPAYQAPVEMSAETVPRHY
jgi:hypothetical protein